MANERGRKLRGLSYEGLRFMGNEPVEHVEVGKRSGWFSIIVEACDDGRLKVVVQGFLDSGWGWKHVGLDGFYKHPDGSVTAMQAKEFYEYD